MSDQTSFTYAQLRQTNLNAYQRHRLSVWVSFSNLVHLNAIAGATNTRRTTLFQTSAAIANWALQPNIPTTQLCSAFTPFEDTPHLREARSFAAHGRCHVIVNVTQLAGQVTVLKGCHLACKPKSAQKEDFRRPSYHRRFSE
jgi:hypothetical protein